MKFCGGKLVVPKTLTSVSTTAATATTCSGRCAVVWSNALSHVTGLEIGQSRFPADLIARLTRRPSQFATAHDMEMQMGDFLATVVATVTDKTVAAR